MGLRFSRIAVPAHKTTLVTIAAPRPVDLKVGMVRKVLIDGNLDLLSTYVKRKDELSFDWHALMDLNHDPWSQGPVS